MWNDDDDEEDWLTGRSRTPATTWYDNMQVCTTGHMITSRAKTNPEDKEDRCSQCGSQTLLNCPKCNAEIPGHKHIPRVAHPGPKTPPDFCQGCGEAFPWFKKVITTSHPLSVSPVTKIETILSRFHAIARQLRDRYDSRPTLDVDDEYDVQDLLHALLLIDFRDIRPEEWTPSYAGGSSRMDFLLKEEDIVIEVKKTRKSLRDRELGEQLIVDIAKYEQHPGCKTLILFTYDPEGLIGNPIGLKNDLEKKSTDKLQVKAFIFPSH